MAGGGDRSEALSYHNMKIEYRSNNSGGSWWLEDQDWLALEAAGWQVHWVKDDPERMKWECAKTGRWLGALATSASKDFESPGEAIREFERITMQNTSNEGCNCCGAPHNFSWGEGADHTWASGDELLGYLYDKVPGSLREACEQLNQSDV
jgi:hypothetical protein